MERIQKSSDGTCVGFQGLAFGNREEAQSKRDLDARLEFPVRSKSDADVMRIYLRVATTIPFGKIRRNRNSARLSWLVSPYNSARGNWVVAL